MKGAANFEWTRPADPALLRFLIGRHKGLLLGWACSWALLFPLLQLFRDPWGLAVTGGFFALFAGPALGAAEVMEGSEEFFLTLPLPKRTFFATRYLLGLLSLFLLLGAGLALFQWNLPQKAWSLVVETGFTEPYPPPRAISLAGALVIPFSLYTFIFVAGSLFKTPNSARNALLAGTLPAAALAGGGFYVEYLVFATRDGWRPTGWLSLILLGVFPLPLLAAGWIAYGRKELDRAPGHAPVRKTSLVKILAFLLLLFFLFMISIPIVRVLIHPSMP